MAVTTKTTVFSDVTPCRLVRFYRLSEEREELFYPEDGGSTLFRKFGKHKPDYTASYRQVPSHFSHLRRKWNSISIWINRSGKNLHVVPQIQRSAMLLTKMFTTSSTFPNQLLLCNIIYHEHNSEGLIG
jgi:hypothetical protein